MSSKKLTREQWIDLDNQFARTPGLGDSFSASGEHYILVGMLNTLGYYPHSREEALEIASQLLTQGWKDD